MDSQLLEAKVFKLKHERIRLDVQFQNDKRLRGVSKKVSTTSILGA